MTRDVMDDILPVYLILTPTGAVTAYNAVGCRSSRTFKAPKRWRARRGGSGPRG